MKILFLGDIVGRSGRDAVTKEVPALRKKLGLDMVIVNAENMAGGFGLTPSSCDSLYQAGVDVITTGNHVWDDRTIIPYISQNKNLIRPINYPPGTPGEGSVVWHSPSGKKILVINVMGRIFMDVLDDPFQALEYCLKNFALGQSIDGVIVDVHAEATSEKMAMAHVLDGRVSFVVGTHTHIPTADTRILAGGTAYQTDAGMCGDYQSIIGMQLEAPIFRFKYRRPYGERVKVANGPATLCGTIVELGSNGLAIKAEPFRHGPNLFQTVNEE